MTGITLLGYVTVQRHFLQHSRKWSQDYGQQHTVTQVSCESPRGLDEVLGVDPGWPAASCCPAKNTLAPGPHGQPQGAPPLCTQEPLLVMCADDMGVWGAGHGTWSNCVQDRRLPCCHAAPPRPTWGLWPGQAPSGRDRGQFLRRCTGQHSGHGYLALGMHLV